MTPSPDPREVVRTIAQQLGETQPGPAGQITRIVRRLGAAAALALLEETKQIEAQGGMLLPDSSRRRTPGGVFFHLVKARISYKDRAAIFWPRRQQPPSGTAQPPQPATPSAKQAPQHPPALLQIDPIPHTTGEVRTVKITLIGRPGPIAAKRDYVMTTMTATKVPSLPKGLPTPPPTPTAYTVYIAPKQWHKVADALRNPDDILIIEGFPAYDPALEAIAVYATNVTTKLLQQAHRAAQQSGT